MPYEKLSIGGAKQEILSWANHVFVTRKGAINAAGGVYGIIPGSMGKKSFIVQGRGSAEFQLPLSRGWTQDVAWCSKTSVFERRLGSSNRRR